MSTVIIKKIALLICFINIIPGLTSCSYKKEENVQLTTETKDTLKCWLRAATKKNVTGILAEKYNKENRDNVRLEFEVFGENYKNVVTMALASDNDPDVFELNGGLSVPQLAEAGNIVPIDKYVDGEIKKDLYPEVFEQKQFYYGGKMYAIPERASYFRLMYNKDIFKKAGLERPPETIEELVEYSKIITQIGQGKFYGFCIPMKTGLGITRFTDNITSISSLTGEAAFDWGTGKFDFMKQRKALQVVKQMQDDKVLYPGAPFLEIEIARVKFGQGEIGMMIDGNWMPGIYGNNEIEANLDWDSAPLPAFKGETRGKSYMYYDMGKMISAHSKYQDKAWNFIKYIFDNQKEFVKSGEALRTSVTANSKENIPVNYKGIVGFSDIENSRAYPLQVQNFLLRLEGDRYDTVYKNILLGEADLDTALTDLTKRYNNALQKALDEGVIKKEDIKKPNE